MDLTELKWTKNINHQHGEKYCAYHPDLKNFPLQWKKGQEENALKPKEGQLIILRQRTKVTHIVKVLDDNLPKEHTDPEFSISREVQVVWVAEHWDVPPDQDTVFGYPLNLQGGKVMKLETPTFNAYWDSRGGFAEFKKHVLKVLKLEKK
jgi:hypothetical protein